MSEEIREDIMACHGVLDDLRTLTWRLDDRRDAIDPEDLANVIRGLESLYEIKFRKLWGSYKAEFGQNL